MTPTFLIVDKKKHFYIKKIEWSNDENAIIVKIEKQQGKIVYFCDQS